MDQPRFSVFLVRGSNQWDSDFDFNSDYAAYSADIHLADTELAVDAPVDSDSSPACLKSPDCFDRTFDYVFIFSYL